MYELQHLVAHLEELFSFFSSSEAPEPPSKEEVIEEVILEELVTDVVQSLEPALWHPTPVTPPFIEIFNEVGRRWISRGLRFFFKRREIGATSRLEVIFICIYIIIIYDIIYMYI